jgi:hypothetical protein
LGLVGLTTGLIEGPAHGWASGLVLSSLVAGAVFLALFVVAERREAHPMLPLGIFSSVQFTATNVATFVVYAALGGALFLVPVELQQVAHYSPFASGVSLLPLTVIMLLFSARSGALAARIGPRLQMSVGPIVAGAGLVLLRLIGPSGNYVTDVLPGVVVLGIGLVITVAPLTSTALSSAPTAHAGMASAVNNDVARAGGLIAVAILPALGGITGLSYLHPALFTIGFQKAVTLAGVAAAFGGLISAAFIRNLPGELRPATPVRMSCPLDATPPVDTGPSEAVA